MIDETRALQRFFALRHDDSPIRALWLGDVDFNHFAARRSQVGLEPEACAFVRDERVRRVEIVKQLHDRRVLRFQIFVVDAVLDVRALVDGDDEVVAVLSYRTAKQPVFLIRSFVNEDVFGLRRASL